MHLGVLASYVQRSDQRLLTLVKCSFPKNALFQFGHNCFSISGIQAVLRFLDSILLFPAFEKQEKNAQFDAKIAEHVVQLSK